MDVMEQTEAEAAGLRSLTTAYAIGELLAARAVCADLERGGISAALVRVPGGLEVWRSKRGMRIEEEL